MQVDHIDENTIRVRITKEELRNRNVQVLDLLGNKDKIQRFFYSILEEVDTDHTFSKGDPVSFQVMPNNGGLDLMITKVNANDGENPLKKLFGDFDDESQDNNDTSFSDLDMNSNKNANSASVGADSTLEQDQNNSYWKLQKGRAYAFNDLSSVIELADSLRANDIASSLYYQRGQYFMKLAFLDENYVELKPADAWAIANEYGIKIDDKEMKTVQETGKCLLEQDALGQIRHYFLKVVR